MFSSVPTPTKPPVSIFRRDREYRVVDRSKDFTFVIGCYIVLQDRRVVAEVGLDCGEGQLNWVVIWRVRGKELASHAPKCL